MPKLSDSMADAVIIRWLVSPGEAFDRGAGLVEVETDKATVIYEAEAAGTLDAILVPEGATASIGEPIATLANGAGEVTRAKPSDGERPNATPNAGRYLSTTYAYAILRCRGPAFTGRVVGRSPGVARRPRPNSRPDNSWPLPVTRLAGKGVTNQ